jgi:transcriptional regulator of acetoin/glycerol metabolism
MPRPPRHAIPDVIAALHAEGGNVSATARRLGLAAQTLVERVGRTPELKRAVRAARRKRPPCLACGGTGVQS